MIKFWKKTENNSALLHTAERSIFDILKNDFSKFNFTTIFDVGAHQGRYSLAALNFWPQAKIYCFEPFPDSYKKLQENLQNKNCSIFNVALSSTIASQTFFINNNSETNSLLQSVPTDSIVDVETSNIRKIEVEVTTLDSFSTVQGIEYIDLLKIDVQGSTFEVLIGASELLLQKKIRVIQCEVEFIPIYKNEKLFNHIWTLAEKFGYKLYSLYNLHYDINGRLSWADALFTS